MVTSSQAVNVPCCTLQCNGVVGQAGFLQAEKQTYPHKCCKSTRKISYHISGYCIAGRDSQVPRRQTSPIFEQPLDPMQSPQQQQQQQPEQAQQQEQRCQHRGLKQTASQPAPPQPLSREAKRLKPFDWDRHGLLPRTLAPPSLSPDDMACKLIAAASIYMHCRWPRTCA